MPVPSVVPSELMRQRACFITLLIKPGNYIRSLYGQILPRYRSLAEEVIVNTVGALEANPGWQPSRLDLPHLAYSVALLGPLQRISDKNHLNPLFFGLYIVSDQGKTAMMLPQRAGVETPDDQIATALRESGIDSRQEATTMYRFEVEYDDG